MFILLIERLSSNRIIKKQEAQHQKQMDGIKKSQRKLIVFCQKLEGKRDDDKKTITKLDHLVKELKQQMCDQDSDLRKMVDR